MRKVDEKGATMVEFAIILPVIILLIAGVLDLSRMIQQYWVFSSVANEALKTGMMVSHLTPGVCENLADSTCEEACSLSGGGDDDEKGDIDESCSGHRLVHTRIKQMLDFHTRKNSIFIFEDSLNVRTKYNSPACDADGKSSNDGYVQVEIRSAVDVMFLKSFGFEDNDFEVGIDASGNYISLEDCD